MSRPLIRVAAAVAMAALAGLAVGCVPAEQFEGMKLARDKYAEQLAHAQSDGNAERARADALQAQLLAGNNSRSATDQLVANQTQQNEELRKQNEDMQRKYEEAVRLAGQMTTASVLPAPLTNQLNDFAAKNPDLITFDAAHGTVKFKSDVTFAAGDATVTAAAKPVLSKFAAILTAAGTSQYDLLVAGNTDDTPVTNKTTIERGHFNNWYLSAHRAIAVGSELIADGVSAKRVGMVGYGDERPAVSNSTASGKAQNRRVEVLILPTTSKGGGGGYAPTASANRKPKPAAREAVPAGAVMGKEGGPAPAPAPAPVPMPNVK